MEKEKFMEDLGKVYEISKHMKSDVSEFLNCLDKDCLKREFLDEFLVANGVRVDFESRFGLASKLSSLKNTNFRKVLESQGFREEKVNEILRNGYDWTREFYEKIREFVLYFQDVFLKFANSVDEEDCKENY